LNLERKNGLFAAFSEAVPKLNRVLGTVQDNLNFFVPVLKRRGL
jgi:hypothetical protein